MLKPITYLTAICLSGIAEYFSIIGLATIFVGAFWPVVLMGSTLAVAKLVATTWLYRNWNTCGKLIRYYLTSAVIVLMLITSMGIFGFLSKAHIDSTLNSNFNSTELKILTTQEKLAKEKLEYLLKRVSDSNVSSRLDKQIQEAQKELKNISEKKLVLMKEENKLTAEIGPIKYVAEAIYGNDESGIDRAVRLVILIIMVVFDPLAVLLLIAANMSTVSAADTKTKRENVVRVKKSNLLTLK